MVNSLLPNLCKKIKCSIISDKNYGKNCYLGNFVFLTPSPPNNAEKEQAKFASSYVMGRNNGFKLLLSGTCEKRVITSTP